MPNKGTKFSNLEVYDSVDFPLVECSEVEKKGDQEVQDWWIDEIKPPNDNLPSLPLCGSPDRYMSSK